MEKECKMCGTVKPSTEYYRTTAFKSGMDSRCKDCRKATNIEYYKLKPEKFQEIRERYVTGQWYVYLLPDHNYVGYTKNIPYRMHQHRHVGRTTSNHQILHTYDREEIAKSIEALYHHIGWEGENGFGGFVRGSRWIHNGIGSTRLREGEFLPEGYVYGRLPWYDFASKTKSNELK